jgi:hypothetical protein
MDCVSVESHVVDVEADSAQVLVAKNSLKEIRVKNGLVKKSKVSHWLITNYY